MHATEDILTIVEDPLRSEATFNPIINAAF